MSSRAAILSAIKKHKPQLVPLPEINLDLFAEEEVNLLDTFIENLKFVGGNVKILDSISDLDAKIQEIYPHAKQIISTCQESNLGTISSTKETDPHSLENIDLAIIKGQFAVAENGAIWISENAFVIRALPFITNDLVLIISKDQLFLHLHDAYEYLSDRERTYGLFLSGPSKTADIEQCLVIGAQGAISLTVFIV